MGSAHRYRMITPRDLSAYCFTNLLYELLESVLYMPVHGSRYGIRHNHADKHEDVHRFYNDYSGELRISALSAASGSLLSLPFFLPPYFSKGVPSSVSSSFASSSVLAVVQITTSMPRILSILSYSISGKINCSLSPSA